MAHTPPGVVERAAAGEMEAVTDLLGRIASKDADVHSAIFTAVQYCHAPALWFGLLTTQAVAAWGTAPLPALAPGSPEHQRLTLQISPLFGTDLRPEVGRVKEAVLLDGLHDPRPAVRASAADLLGLRRATRLAGELIVALDDPDPAVRRRVARALGRIGTPMVVDALIAALASDDPGLRSHAYRALVDVGQPAVPRLIDTLFHPDEHMRWEAARALATIRSAAAAEALVRALEDSSGGVRWLAAEALIALRRAGLEPLLHALTLRAGSVWFRAAAHRVLSTLARLGEHDLLAPVVAALDGPEPALGAPLAARRALDKLTARPATGIESNVRQG